MGKETVEDFEKLNARIDVWIDQEEYKRIYEEVGTQPPTLTLDGNINFGNLFTQSDTCTHGQDDVWTKFLTNDFPVEQAGGRKLDKNNPSERYWSCLFFAKLLRARIMEKGTDCYFRRLDEVTLYLEKHLAELTFGSGYKPADANEKTKLTIVYLLELAASSKRYESLGFAERAREALKRISNKDGFSYWYYELVTKYNMGVAYFHVEQHKKSIIEFNTIIKKIDKADREKRKLFDDYLVYRLLYLPAVLYRADIQLKLQLAYHALHTLSKYFEDCEYVKKHANKPELLHKEVRAKLIEAEANQQMGRLGDDESWSQIKIAFDLLCKLESVTPKPVLNRADNSGFPESMFNNRYADVKGRWLDVCVKDYLEWLALTYSYDNKTKGSDTYPNNITNARSRLSRLKRIFSEEYFDSLKYKKMDREGYYEQLARFLQFLTCKYLEEKRHRSKIIYRSEKGNHLERFLSIARLLYKRNSAGLMQNIEEDEHASGECQICCQKGIDLSHMATEHFTWFSKAILCFYNGVNLAEDKEKFVRHLAKKEIDRDDIRFNMLKLRYESSQEIENWPPENAEGKMICEPSDNTGFRKYFAGLLGCVDNKIEDKNRLDSSDYEHIMKLWRNRFLRHLEHPSKHLGQKGGLYFLGLQRWNSSSPAEGRSVGGGYLIYKTDEKGVVNLGIAIDPGFDFLRNLFHTGFSLDDIDIILISHSHVDHIRDFESIAILLQELDKRATKKKVVHVILSLGVYKRLKHVIEDSSFRYFIEPYIIDTHREIDSDYFENTLSQYSFSFVESKTHPPGIHIRYYSSPTPKDGKTVATIIPTRAYHPDPSNYSDSFGFKIKVRTDNNHCITIGYTGDTKWIYPEVYDVLQKRPLKDIASQYEDCQAIIVHLGSLIDFWGEKAFKDYANCRHGECETIIREKDHLYLVGILRLMRDLNARKRKQLVLIGEFGEELGGKIRIDLVNRLGGAYQSGDETSLSFLPVDVGINVRLWSSEDSEYKVKCTQCEEFLETNRIDFETYGVDEALYCVCKTCMKAVPLGVLQDKLRLIYEEGYSLEYDEPPSD